MKKFLEDQEIMGFISEKQSGSEHSEISILNQMDKIYFENPELPAETEIDEENKTFNAYN